MSKKRKSPEKLDAVEVTNAPADAAIDAAENRLVKAKLTAYLDEFDLEGACRASPATLAVDLRRRCAWPLVAQCGAIQNGSLTRVRVAGVPARAVSNRSRAMRAQAQDEAASLRRELDIQLMKFSKRARSLTVAEFVADFSGSVLLASAVKPPPSSVAAHCALLSHSTTTAASYGAPAVINATPRQPQQPPQPQRQQPTQPSRLVGYGDSLLCRQMSLACMT